MAKHKKSVKQATVSDCDAAFVQSFGKLQVAGDRATTRQVKRKTVVREFDKYFGKSNELANWQRLCTDLGIEHTPESISKCKKVSQQLQT
jgi:hypothetical protein